jgi:hypothetical protein
MNDQECREVFDDLSRMLQDTGLADVLAEVADEIRFGMIERRESRTPENRRSSPHAKGRRLPGIDRSDEAEEDSGETAAQAVEFTPKEQLILLIDAIQQSIVNAALVEYEVVSFFGQEVIKGDGINTKLLIPSYFSDQIYESNEGLKGVTIDFEPDLADQENYDLSFRDIIAQRDQVVRLHALLEELRREVI